MIIINSSPSIDYEENDGDDAVDVFNHQTNNVIGQHRNKYKIEIRLLSAFVSLYLLSTKKMYISTHYICPNITNDPNGFFYYYYCLVCLKKY